MANNIIRKKISKKHISLALLVFFLCIVLIINFIFAFRIIRSWTSGNHRNIRSMRANREKLTVDNIEIWMTFDFINKTFGLMPSYLKEKIGIKDSRYPFLTLKKFAREKNLDSESFLGQVQQAIRENQPQAP